MVTTATPWTMTGRGFEFCNCDFGCACNFGGFPNSKDGNCRALVGWETTKGACGEGRGDAFKNPVTGEDHLAHVHLPDGFIWEKGECGQGGFDANVGSVSIGAEKSNWILYDFDWSNGWPSGGIRHGMDN